MALPLDPQVSRFSEKQAVTILETQRDAYLVALNSLRVLDEEHAWFVRPHVAIASAKRKRTSAVCVCVCVCGVCLCLYAYLRLLLCVVLSCLCVFVCDGFNK